MAASVGAFILSAGATTTAATGGALFFAQYAVGYLATTALTTTVLNALAPKPSIQNAGATGYQVAGKSAAADHQVIYGTTRAGGVIVYDATTGTDNKFLHRVVAFAGHEIEEYTTFYLNDEALTLDSNGNVTTPSRYNGYVRIKTHLGTDDQTADTDLVTEVSEWTGEHRLRGVAYAYIRLKYDQDVFPNGVPDISCVIKGKKVYDPRTATTAWSENPALCIRDYLTSEYGLNESSSRIDDELVKTAAQVCDHLNYPTLNGGSRFTLNGNFVTSVTPHDLLTDMLTSMGGLLWYSQGKWRMKPAYYTSSVLDLNEDDLRSSISVATRHSRRNNFNEVKGTFRGPDTNYQPTDYNPVFNITDADELTSGQPYAIHQLGNTNWNTAAGTSGVTYAVGDVFVAANTGNGNGKANYWLGVDGGDESTIDLNLSFTDDFDIARRIARIMLERNRQQITVQAKFGMRAFQVQVGDTVRITNSRFGWTNKEFEVVNWSFGLADDKDLQTDLTLREISSNVFDDVDDGAALELDNTSLDSPFDVQVPTLDAAVVNTHVNEDGTTVPSITFSWSVTNPQLVEYYEFQYKLTGDTTYNTRIVKDGEYTLAPALSGSAYNYRVRSVNQLGVKSQFVSGASTASTGNDATTPAKPTSPSAAAGYQSITLTWTAPQYNVDAQGDPDNNSPLKDLFQYRIYRGTTTNPTTLVGRVSGEIFTDSGLNDGTTYYYRIKAVDFTGNESDYSDNASATTNSALLDGFNSATVFLYKKNTSPTTAPADPTGTFTYTFSTGALSGGTLNGWSQTPPTLSEGDYMWAITATAASRTSTDSIPASEFSDAIVFTESAEAYRAATVTLYKKNTSGTTAPADPTGTFTYTFATAALSGGTLDGWSQSAPSLDKGEYLWVIQATAFNNATTDSIAVSEFSTAVIGGIGGEDGPTGASTNIIFQRSASAPTTPSASEGVPTGWYDNPPAGTDLLWASSGVKAVNTSTFTWGAPFRIEGEAVAEVSIYRKNSNAGASGGSYNFTTNTLTPPTNWSINPPSLSANGDIIYRATGITSGAATATAASVSYGAAVIYAQRTDGTSITGPEGPRGAGRWYIGVTTLPITSSGADTDFTNAIGDPVDRDQAWFYEGTQANPTAQNVWIYTESTDTWEAQEEFIDGNLVVAGTITGDKINTNAITADKIEAGAVNADKMTIDGELILGDDAGFLAGRDFNSAYEDDGFFVGRETRADGTQGFEVSTSSVNDNNELTGIIHNEQDHLQIFNPVLLIGGDVSGGVDTYTSTQTVNLGINTNRTITVTALGGGGGGGGGHANQGDNVGGTGAQGGTTTVKIYHTSTSSESNLITTISASGGAGGQSGGGARGGHGTNGGTSAFGVGGTGGGENQAGGDANSQHYGAGGGGAGGDDSSLFDKSGAAGLGGSAAVPVIENINITQTTTIYAVITAIGSGGAGDTTGVSYYGGDGAAGAVSISSVFGGTHALPAKEITPMDIWALGDVQQKGRANYTVTSSSTTAHKSNSQDVLWLLDGWGSATTNGDWWLGGNGRIITQWGYEGQFPNSNNRYLWNERDFVSSSSQNYRSSNSYATMTAPSMIYFEAGTYMDTDRSAVFNNVRFITEANIPSGYSVEDIARIYLRNLKDYNH